MARKKKIEDLINVNDREAAINLLKSQYADIDREFEADPINRTECLPFPSTQLNILTNDGGMRPGTVLEFYGDEGTCKSSIALQTCREAQLWKPEKAVAWIDAESTFDKWVAKNHYGIETGVDNDGVPKFVLYPDREFDTVPAIEELLDRIYKFATTGLFSLIVLDSYAACASFSEQKSEHVSEKKFAGMSGLVRPALRQIVPILARTGTVLWIINQFTTDIIQTPTGTIAKQKPLGGNSIRYNAGLRLRTKWEKREEGKSRALLEVKADKVRFGPPMQQASIPITLGYGIDKQADLLFAAIKQNVVQQNGSWYTYNGVQLGQGDVKTSKYLKENPEVYQEILNLTLDKALLDLDK